MNPFEHDLMDKLFEKFREPGTWQGITILAGLAGITFTPEQTEAFAVGIAGVYALIDVFKKG